MENFKFSASFLKNSFKGETFREINYPFLNNLLQTDVSKTFFIKTSII